MKASFFALLLLAPITLSAATSGTLHIQGAVPKKVELTVTPAIVASALDLEITQTNLSVASLVTKSNVNAGYSVSVASANLGNLKHASVIGANIPYTLKINSTSINLATGQSLSFSGKGVVTRDVNISYTGVDAYVAEEGSYDDTLTFTISAN